MTNDLVDQLNDDKSSNKLSNVNNIYSDSMNSKNPVPNKKKKFKNPIRSMIKFFSRAFKTKKVNPEFNASNLEPRIASSKSAEININSYPLIELDSGASGFSSNSYNESSSGGSKVPKSNWPKQNASANRQK